MRELPATGGNRVSEKLWVGIVFVALGLWFVWMGRERA